MPLRRTLTGWVERRNRNRLYNTRGNQQDVPNLTDSFKCALREVPREFCGSDIGFMNLECRFCHAKHFQSEATRRDTAAFTSCCHKGKIVLQPLTQNCFFKTLFDGLFSAIRGLKERSVSFFKNIRSFNSSFAMVSSEAKIANNAQNGPYHFKIHDTFYHRAGPMTTSNNHTPVYAQLYFYDVDTAVNYRAGHQSNSSCNRHLIREIELELERVNPYVRSFKTMKNYCSLPGNESKEISLQIKVNRELDIRRYNDAVQTDVAVIFSTLDGEPPFDRNIITFSKTHGNIRTVSVLDASLDPLAYPMLFPNGDSGWHVNMTHHNQVVASTSRAPRNKVTMLQYACYRLAIRNDFSWLHISQKLFLQWVVDMYVRVEGTRLHFIRQNQKTIRSDVFNNVTDFLESNIGGDDTQNIGRRVILPSSFIGSPRNMFQNYLDAMAIVQVHGKPTLFITMTCNPKWPEITRILGDTAESASYRPEIVVRVFNAKLKELIAAITQKEIFGKVKALIYTVEFQKRGLPHAHILLTLEENDRIINATDIDKVVMAELPNIETQPKLREYVVKHMMHGPCGHLNINAVCMRDGKCSKNFPKEFNESTRESSKGFPVYRRRDSGDSAEVRGSSLDNRFVVPYNPYLLAKFNCHINVEVCTTVKSVKYIYNYVYKGYDCATVELGQVPNEAAQNIQIDEIKDFLNGRYVGSTEAVWRIFEIPMHFQSHVIYRLDIHLPRQQTVYFRPGHERQAVENIKQTKLLAFFELNQTDESANDYKYTEIPVHYVWVDTQKKWKKRLIGGNKVISRLYSVSPKAIELFHLRILLLHVKGPKSFEDVRTYNGIVYNTFVEACHARGIASNDNEWRECLNEAKDFNMPRKLRELFGFICALNVPTNALALWNEFKNFLSEDFLREYDEDTSFNRVLLEIEEILSSHNMSCASVGLPVPIHLPEDDAVEMFDPHDELLIFSELYASATAEQRNVVDLVIREVQHHDTGSNVFCLTAHAGCGKTFTQTTIIHRVRSLNLSCIVTAFSGIASTLLIGGRTLHNVFKLPIPLLETSVANVTPNSDHGRYLNAASLIIIDEISMCPLQALKVIDRLLRDLSINGDEKNKVFGGKTVLLCGDFRQILPVIPHGSRSTLIENCIISWNVFPEFHHLTLTQNMRALPEEVEFVEFLKTIGNGEAAQYPQFGEDIIEIPKKLVGEETKIIDDIFGNIADDILSVRMLNSVILAPTNDSCSMINNEILNRIPGEQNTYFSYDKIISDELNDVNNYPIEFLNSLDVSGLPPHKLSLKINAIVLLIRNLNTSKSLVNGTRMRIKAMHRNTIDCEVLSGTAKGSRILIPRLNLTYSGTMLPFSFQRTQFPVIHALAMTINKSQGQTFDNVGILLRQPVFAHGQLYVASSRVKSFSGLKFYISNNSGQGNLANDNRTFTKNIVYTEIVRF